jgi:hypothetical protein
MLKRSVALGFLIFASSSNVGGVASADCAHSGEFVEKQIAGSDRAFRAEVVAASPDATLSPLPPYFEQKVTFRVLSAWKGSYRTGALVHLVLEVTTVCAGLGCVFPFKVGDVDLVLSPATAPFSAPMYADGCWMHNGVTITRVLIVPWMEGP